MISYPLSNNKYFGLLVVCLSVFSFLSVCFVAVDPVSAQEIDSADNREMEFTYNPIGHRDPFTPLVNKIFKTGTRPKRDLGPLEKFQLSQFRLMAMLIIKGTPRAMVKAPDGKSYTVKPGDLIGQRGGVVTKIETKTVGADPVTGQRVELSPDRVVVEETGVDNFTGKSFKEERYIEM
jgi:hypothetical protein